MLLALSRMTQLEIDVMRGKELAELRQAYWRTRSATLAICTPLEIEDYVTQPISDASPPKWHLAHTSWFFEEVILRRFARDFKPFHPLYRFLFNSYYVAAGPFWERSRRGTLSRPTVAEILKYREWVDERVDRLLSEIDRSGASGRPEVQLIRLGIEHEMQHQELLYTDILAGFAANPLHPVLIRGDGVRPSEGQTVGSRWISLVPGIRDIGSPMSRVFSYDNERPRHRVYVGSVAIMNRLVTNGEWLEFMRAGGYERPELWLSAGWDFRVQEGWTMPLYWERRGDRFEQATLGGMREVDPSEPVCHVSYFEADAFAKWNGARLPTEDEWETAAQMQAFEHDSANFADTGLLRAVSTNAASPGPFHDLFGNVWEWTGSAYLPYPGFRPDEGIASEYNGKFMSGQMVLRGGSCATPREHFRIPYRNYFAPQTRWQFSGVRLARDDRSPE